MSEHLLAAQRLAVETGILAGRLEALLDRVLPEANQATDGRGFLHSTFTSIAKDWPLENLDNNPLSRRPKDSLHPIDRLVDALALSRIETELCLLAGMPEEHEGFAAVFRALHPRGEPRPTIGLAAQLFCETAQDRFVFRELLETSLVVASGVLLVTGDTPYFERSLELATGLWPVLAGIDFWPSSVPRVVAPITLAGLEEWLASPSVMRAVTAMVRREAFTVLVMGDTEDAAFQRALALASHAGYEPTGFAIPQHLDNVLEQLIGVHTLTRGSIPVMRITVSEGSGVTEAPQFLNYPGPIVLCARIGSLQINSTRPLITVTLDRLSSAARRRLWCAVLPTLSDESTFLAARYNLEPSVAASVALDLEALNKMESRPAAMEDVSAIIRARAGLSLTSGVKLITPTATWDDLVLPEDRLALLREACSRLLLQNKVLDEWGFLKGRTGARGVRMLFAGQPGTGKTLAAEVLAHALSVDLLCVDISRVVSKWIGETEKNLAAIFETAERAQAVLFFDEADALFGKRTEVSDAHDRYANLETAYLLSRLERFEGLTILASNLRQNIDQAFIRRLEFAIDFDVPDSGERLALWKVHVPTSAPLAIDVNLQELAAIYPVVGAFIRNAATAAGFLAAGNGGIINQDHFIHAIWREYVKSGRAFPGSVSDKRNYQSERNYT
ncbi:ATP-binding protein [Methyloglobulus sp.]|uniref:ATP-binding protein n=1 Tax=Methyloglobulus sp. TaxID=2518622 RepID=UPI0032B7E18F